MLLRNVPKTCVRKMRNRCLDQLHVTSRIAFLIVRSACCALIARNAFLSKIIAGYRHFRIINSEFNDREFNIENFSAVFPLLLDLQMIRSDRYAFDRIIRSRRGRFPLFRGLIDTPQIP